MLKHSRGKTMSTEQEALDRFSQSFKLGWLLAVLEFNGDFEPITEKGYLEPTNTQKVLSLLPSAIYRANENGHRDKIEDLVLSIGDVPRELDEKQQKEFVDGYRTEALLQTPFPGYFPRCCEPYFSRDQ